ncbi:MAG: hypothetical protein ACRDPA_28825, partial [Solirubrobacteraceae bacterium]
LYRQSRDAAMEATMLVQPDHAPAQVDPDTLTPLYGEAEFAELIAELVAEEAPRLFAVVQEYGERVDGRIAAWGMAFENGAEVIGVDRGIHVSMQSPERAVRGFTCRPHIMARLVWVDPALRSRAGSG